MRSRAVLCLFRLLLQPCDLNVLLLHLAQQPSTAINSTYRGRHGPAIPRHRLRLANGVFLAVAAGRQQNGCGHGFWGIDMSAAQWQMHLAGEQSEVERRAPVSCWAAARNSVSSVLWYSLRMLCHLGESPWSLRLNNPSKYTSFCISTSSPFKMFTYFTSIKQLQRHKVLCQSGSVGRLCKGMLLEVLLGGDTVRQWLWEWLWQWLCDTTSRLPRVVQFPMHLLADEGSIPERWATAYHSPWKWTTRRCNSDCEYWAQLIHPVLKKKWALWCVVAVDNCSIAIRTKVFS